jgi:hypothetical protein
MIGRKMQGKGCPAGKAFSAGMTWRLAGRLRVRRPGSRKKKREAQDA